MKIGWLLALSLPVLMAACGTLPEVEDRSYLARMAPCATLTCHAAVQQRLMRLHGRVWP